MGWTKEKTAWCCKFEKKGCPDVCPATCSSWFDGCNNCKCVAVGEVGTDCTKKLCESTRNQCAKRTTARRRRCGPQKKRNGAANSKKRAANTTAIRRRFGPQTKK